MSAASLPFWDKVQVVIAGTCCGAALIAAVILFFAWADDHEAR